MAFSPRTRKRSVNPTPTKNPGVRPAFNFDDNADYSYAEYGVVGVEQADETYFDQRNHDDDPSEGDEDDDEGRAVNEKGRIKFSKKKMYGREKELLQFDECFSLLRNPLQNYQSQVVFLSGYSGCGKTRLVNEAVAQFAKNTKVHPIFIQGKYVESNANEMYKGIADAFRKWYSTLSAENKEVLQYVKNEMKQKVGDDTAILASIIPSFGRLMAEDEAPAEGDSSTLYSGKMSPMSHDTPEHINKSRLHFVFHSFIECLCTKDIPMVMFLDDLQWADSGSLDMLLSILSDSSIKHFLFVGAYRSNEVQPQQELSIFMGELEVHRHIEVMELNDLTKDDLNEFIGDTLQLGTEEVGPLTEAIYSKTLGNMFFSMQALEQLVRKNALYYDVISFQWSWVLPKDQLEALLSNEVLEMVKSKIENMPTRLQKMLIVASYTRSTFHVSILRELLNKERRQGEWTIKNLFKLLDRAVAEGLLLNPGGTEEYAFAHDRIREAAMSLLTGDAKDELLFHIGHILADRGASQTLGEDWMIFTSVRHLNAVPKSFHDRKSRLKMARLHLETSKLSINKAAFENAAKYAEEGIRWLPSNAWQKHTRLARRLYSTAAEAARLLGNIEKMENYCNKFLKEQEHESLDIKFQVYFTLANGIFYSTDRYEEAMKIMLRLLTHLNCKFPKSGVDTISKTIYHLAQLKISKKKRECYDFEKLESMTDPLKMESMRLLDKLFEICYMTNDSSLLPLVICRGIEYTFKYGLSIYSPRFFSAACILFTSHLNDIKGGIIYAKYAMKLLKKVDQRQIEAGTLLVAYRYGFHFSTPVKDCVKPLQRAYDLGMKSGVIATACWAKWVSIALSFQAGLPLALIEADCNKHLQLMDKMGQRMIAILVRGNWNLVLAVLGRSNDLVQLKMTENEVSNPFIREICRGMWRIGLVHLGDYEVCADSAAECGDALIKASPGAPIPVYDTCACALSSIIMLRRTGKSKYRKELNRTSKLIKSWAKQGNPNMQHWVALLDAESAAIKRKIKMAVKSYSLALNLALDGGFVHDAAIVNERWGDFAFYIMEDYDEAEVRLKEALKLCKQWGANGKSKRLKDKNTDVALSNVDASSKFEGNQRTSEPFPSNEDMSSAISFKKLDMSFRELDISAHSKNKRH